MNTVKLPKACKIESAASKDSTRPFITTPFFRDGRLIATDGKILASLAIETDAIPSELEGKKLPVEALKASRKIGGSREETARLTLTTDNRCEVAGGASYPIPDTHEGAPQVPRVAEIVSARRESNAPEAFCVTLDVALLSRLSEALGSSALRLVFNKEDPKSIITATPTTGADAFGLIMPMNI